MTFDEDWKSKDTFYDWEKHRYRHPNYTTATPSMEYRQIREDAWECGDKDLLSQAGSYFTRLYNYQRKQQAKQRRKELKELGHWETPFVFYFPIQNWFQEGLKLVHFDYIKAHPFLSLYTTEMPKFNDPKKYTYYIEDIQTLKVFPYDRKTHHYGNTVFKYLPKH